MSKRMWNNKTYFGADFYPKDNVYSISLIIIANFDLTVWRP